MSARPAASVSSVSRVTAVRETPRDSDIGISSTVNAWIIAP
ncbi:hypothetical protein [Nocardia sp. NPDC005366]